MKEEDNIYEIPGLGKTTTHYVSWGRFSEALLKVKGLPEEERPYRFTISLLASMLVDPKLTEMELENLQPPILDQLTLVAVKSCGLEDEYASLADGLSNQERFYKAHFLWLEQVKTTASSLVAQAISPLIKDATTVASLALTGAAQSFGELITNEFKRSLASSVASVAPIFQNIIGQLNPFEDIAELIEENRIAGEKLSDDVGPMLIKAGFWMTPSFPEIFIVTLAQLKRDGQDTPEKVTEKVIEMCEENDSLLLRSMVDDWAKIPIFNKRIHIIRDALEAHINGRFTLSIPTLLPLVEGILVEMTEKPAGRQLYETVKTSIEEMCSDFWFSSYKKAFLDFMTSPRAYNAIDRPFFTPSLFPKWMELNGYEAKDILNRHAIPTCNTSWCPN